MRADNRRSNSSAFRLQHNATIMQRLQELRTLVTSAFVQLAITEREQRTVGGAKNARIVEEYEINTALIEALNSVEKRAAIETGQEQEFANRPRTAQPWPDSTKQPACSTSIRAQLLIIIWLATPRVRGTISRPRPSTSAALAALSEIAPAR
jgi:hypothetical protein